jgi:hypothetical protein
MHRSLLSAVLSVSVLLSALVAAHVVQAATLSVANNGLDSDTCGASAAPCRSISQAIAHANEGDTLMVGPGRYGDLNGNRILGEEGEEPAAFGNPCSCMIHLNKDLREGSCDRTSFEPTERKKDRGWQMAGPFALCFLPSHTFGSARVTRFVTSR